MLQIVLCGATIAALASSLQLENKEVTKYSVETGLPDGAILTFYFKHTGDDGEPESVSINFYDLPHIPIDEVYDITAHLRIDRDNTQPVASNSYVNGKWLTETRREQPLDEKPPSNGWWRVDVVKLDKYRLNVFFQGFWSDVRTFEKSLDNIQSIYVISNYVDHNSGKIRIKMPNSNLVPPSFDAFKHFIVEAEEGRSSKYNLINFNSFPVGCHIEMVAVMRASGGAKKCTPSLIFGEGPSGEFLRIFQKWDDGMELWGDDGTPFLCTVEKPNGDLQHFTLRRIAQNFFTMQVFYKTEYVKNNTCIFVIDSTKAKRMNEPFSIWSHDGAHLLHVDHSIPRSVETGGDKRA